MATGNKIQKTDWYYFSILSNSYFIKFIPRSHIYRDTGVAAFMPGLQGWMFGQLGWSSGPAKLVGWPLQLKTGTAAVFTCQLCLKNKTHRQSQLTLGYFWVQYHFALHPPFNINYINNFASLIVLRGYILTVTHLYLCRIRLKKGVNPSNTYSVCSGTFIYIVMSLQIQISS